MLRSRFVVAPMAVFATALVAAACGSSTTPTPTPPASGIQPPAANPAAPAGDGPGYVYAVSKLYLGDTNRDGTPNPNDGWKALGFDIDGKISTKDSTDLCTPAAGASKGNVYPDGNNGIDNSFGHLIYDSIIHGISGDASTKINDGIAQGKFTIMLDIQKLGAGTSYNGLNTLLYGGSNLMGNPKFDGTDKWPVIQELLNTPTDINSAKVQFPGSYLVNNTWVSGGKGDINLQLSVAGFSLSLTIGSAQIAMDIDPARKGATNGTIAGVLDTEVLVTEIQKIAGAFDPGLCTGTTINGILNQIRQASDIMKNGTQDPTQTCNGISIGLGFDAKPVQLGKIAPPAMAKGNACMH